MKKAGRPAKQTSNEETTEVTHVVSPDVASENETVTIAKSDLDSVLKKIAILEKSVNQSKLKRNTPAVENERQVEIRIAIYDGPEKEHRGKVITGIRMTRNYVRATKNGLVEEQELEITLDDDSIVNMPYEDLSRVINREKVILDNEKTIYNRDKSLKVAVFEFGGKEYALSPTVINI